MNGVDILSINIISFRFYGVIQANVNAQVMTKGIVVLCNKKHTTKLLHHTLFLYYYSAISFGVIPNTKKSNDSFRL